MPSLRRPSSPYSQQRSSLHHSLGFGNSLFERFVVHGINLRINARTHGRGRSPSAPVSGIAMGIIVGDEKLQSTDRHPRTRRPLWRHGLQGRRNCQGTHRHSNGCESRRRYSPCSKPCSYKPKAIAPKSSKMLATLPRKRVPPLTLCATHHRASYQSGENPRCYGTGRQNDQPHYR